MTDVSFIDKMWKLNGYNRSSRQILYSFLNISKGKTSINVTNDNKEVVLLYNTIHTLLESLDNDEKCLYPSFTNGNILFILFFLILFLGFIDIPEKIKLRRPSTIDKKKLNITNDDLIKLYTKLTSFLCNPSNSVLDVDSL